MAMQDIGRSRRLSETDHHVTMANCKDNSPVLNSSSDLGIFKTSSTEYPTTSRVAMLPNLLKGVFRPFGNKDTKLRSKTGYVEHEARQKRQKLMDQPVELFQKTVEHSKNKESHPDLPIRSPNGLTNSISSNALFEGVNEDLAGRCDPMSVDKEHDDPDVFTARVHLAQKGTEVADIEGPKSSCVTHNLYPSVPHEHCQQADVLQPQVVSVLQENPSQGSCVHDITSLSLIYCFKGTTNLYVGYEDRIQLPKYQLDRWNNDISPRLWVDLREFQNRMKRSKKGQGTAPSLSPELRMSGYVTKGETKVTLSPQIWILYDKSRWKSDLEKLVKELEWLGGEGFGHIEIRKGAPRLCNSNKAPIIESLNLDKSFGFSLQGGLDLYLHTERAAEQTSACGLLCCATIAKDGNIIQQRLSRIGGLIWLEGKIFGTTTAHGMFAGTESMRALLDRLPEAQNAGGRSDIGSGSENESSGEGSEDGEESSEDEEESSPHTQLWSKRLGEIDLLSINGWDPIRAIGPTGFLGCGGPSLHSLVNSISSLTTSRHKEERAKEDRPERELLEEARPPETSCDSIAATIASDADFSLWTMQNHFMTHSYCGKKSKTTIVCTLEPTEEISPGSVQLILRSEDVVEGQLLEGSSRLSFHGAEFETRKIRFPSPLARGCSGCWVIRDQVLLGMIIAAYDAEPYAHMVCSAKLLDDIAESSAGIQAEILPQDTLGESPATDLPPPIKLRSVDESSAGGLQWGYRFCLACDKLTDGTVYCSESCRLADYENIACGGTTCTFDGSEGKISRESVLINSTEWIKKPLSVDRQTATPKSTNPNCSRTFSGPANSVGFYMQYLESLCRRRNWRDPSYECYRDENGYTCLVLVNGREYQTARAYESDLLAQENAAMRAFMICRNFSVNGGMLARNGIIQGLPRDSSRKPKRQRYRAAGGPSYGRRLGFDSGSSTVSSC